MRSPIDDARRRHRILKELVRRERAYTKGYVDLKRLYDIGVLEKGTIGPPKEVAQRTLDDLDRVIDALGFLDITAAFESVATKQIGELIAATRGKLRADVDGFQLPAAAPDLLRNIDEFEKSLKAIVDLIGVSTSADDAEKLDSIKTVRNDIAHGRMPEATPLPHDELAALLTKLIERRLTKQQ